MARSANIASGIVAGALAGFAATFVMTRFQELWNEIEGNPKSPEEAGGTPESEEEEETATVKVAEAVSEKVFRHRLEQDEKSAAGNAAHIAFGASAGAVYGALAEVYPLVTTGGGVAYGAALWGLADNVVVPSLGLSKWPTAYPLSTSVYGLASHVVYGTTLELARGLLRAFL